MIPSASDLDRAKAMLGNRWGEDRARGCYTLDGRPCNAKDLMTEARRVEDAERQIRDAAQRAADDIAASMLRGW